MQPRPESLAEIETALWRELARATQDREHEWRHAALATTDGEAGDARTVVLREATHERQEVVLFTDARSPKLAQIASHPRGTLLLWSRRLSWQLRLRLNLSAHTEGLAVASRWARLRHTTGAADYLAPHAPGTPLAAAPTAGARREHFALIVGSIQAIDWLELDPAGNRRAWFEGGKAHWLAP